MAYESGAGKSEEWRRQQWKKFYDGLKDGSIKPKLPSELDGPHIRIPQASRNTDLKIASASKPAAAAPKKQVQKGLKFILKQQKKKADTIQSLLDEI